MENFKKVIGYKMGRKRICVGCIREKERTSAEKITRSLGETVKMIFFCSRCKNTF